MSKDNSPNSLKAKPEAKEVSKKYLYIAVFMLVIIFGVYIYNVLTSGAKVNKGQIETYEIDEADSQSFLLAEGSGLAVKEEQQESGIIQRPQTPVSEAKEPIIIVRDRPEEIKINDEHEQIRKIRTQNYLSALSSPVISKQYANESNHTSSNPQTINYDSPQVNPLAMSLDIGNTGQNAYNPSADKDKEEFFSRAMQNDKAWISNDIRTQGQDFEIKTGSVIPAIMVTGINSDLPGHLIAQISQDVYDSSSGMNMLIPQGSKLFGVYDSRIIYGQERVLVAWNRIIFPDGSALTLPAMGGADLSGMAGFSDEVDNHYFKTFGSAILMSLITAGTSYALDMSGAIGDESSLQAQLTASLAQQIGETSANLLEKNLNIKPTLEIRSGYQFNIVLTKDLVFQSPYHAWK